MSAGQTFVTRESDGVTGVFVSAVDLDKLRCCGTCWHFHIVDQRQICTRQLTHVTRYLNDTCKGWEPYWDPTGLPV